MAQTKARKERTIPHLGPDGKSQVSVSCALSMSISESVIFTFWISHW